MVFKYNYSIFYELTGFAFIQFIKALCEVLLKSIVHLLNINLLNNAREETARISHDSQTLCHINE